VVGLLIDSIDGFENKIPVVVVELKCYSRSQSKKVLDTTLDLSRKVRNVGEILVQKKGTIGFEPMTYRAAIDCSTTELCTLVRRNKAALCIHLTLDPIQCTYEVATMGM
jgi:hypothetical protein